jgi:AGZA family xanthine/uracil permease-like MFS transporter
MNTLEGWFGIRAQGSRPETEVAAGVTTFMTMSYIIFLQPMILSGRLFGMDTGMDLGALTVGVCLAAAFGSILMGVLANYPVALAPGMGENFFFVLTVVPACVAVTSPAGGWRLALGVVLLSGVVFTVLSLFQLRQLLLRAVSPSLQFAIAGGIGLFIALLGLEHGGVIHTAASGHYELSVGTLSGKPTLVFIVGLAATSALLCLRVRGGILWGILVAASTAFALGLIQFPDGMIGLPPNPAPVFAQADVVGVFRHFTAVLPLLVIFTFMDVFDTLGTLVGVGTQAGLMRNGELPRASRAFAADSLATVFGAICGHSTVTSYIESAAGVEQGGRTGLTAVTTGACFLAALFFVPLIGAVGQCSAITAPALVVVGALMLKNVGRIAWDDYSEAIPSFLVLAGIPFTYSIADGLTLGFIAAPVIKLLGGKYRETGWLTVVIAVMLVVYLLVVKTAVLKGT